MVTATGSPISTNLADGLDRDQVRDRLTAIGMDPGDDLLDWFAWHNGLIDPQTPQSDLREMPYWEFYSLDQALADWAWQDKGTEAWEWVATWLPIAWFGGSPRLAVNCTPPAGQRSTVLMADPETGLFDEEAMGNWERVDGLDAAVDLWIEAIETKRLTWNPVNHRWDLDSTRPPRSHSGLV